MCETVRVFPGLISPTHFLKLDQRFSDAVCAEIDKGLAQYVQWYESRREERKKVGKHSWTNKYKDLRELLGIVEEERRGGWQDGAELKAVSKDYAEAVLQAAKEGKPVPDVEEWLKAQEEGDPEEEGSDWW